MFKKRPQVLKKRLHEDIADEGLDCEIQPLSAKRRQGVNAL